MALQVLDRKAVALKDVPFARGYVERLGPAPLPRGNRFLARPMLRWTRVLRPLEVSGWTIMPEGPFDYLTASVGGREFWSGEPGDRPDVGAAFPHIHGASRAGFRFDIPVGSTRRGWLTIAGYRNLTPVGKVVLRFRSDLLGLVPLPPPELTNRVVGERDSQFFLVQGYKSYGEIQQAIARHRPMKSIRRLLDWGCGCGRIAAHWLRRREGIEVHGCDIDERAISWCRENLPRGQFNVIPFQPPTGYPDGHFDAIFGYSVFTHLTRDAQIAWLEEMRRITAPGAIFIATVQGPSSAWFLHGADAEHMLASGIHDGTHDPGMESIVGDGVYRRTYQTPDWTQQTFGKYFEVVEYVERAIGNDQDLVVLRRR